LLLVILTLLLVLIFEVLFVGLLTTASVLLLLLVLFLLTVDSGQVSLISIEDILHALLAQGLLGIEFVLDLEFGQFNSDLLLLLFGLFQQLFQLLALLDFGLLDLVQTILVLGHDDVHGQFLLLSGHTDNLQLLIFVVVELALALQNLDVLRLLASQRVEAALLGGLLLTELTSPFGLDLSGADDDHLGIFGDGILGHGLFQVVLGLLGDVTVDLLTALLGLTLEVAFLHLDVQAGLDGLDELMLGVVALVDDDGGGGLDLSLLVLAILVLLLLLVLSLEALLQSGMGLALLLLGQTSADDALDLTFGIAASAALNGGQSQVESGRRDNGVLVVVLLLGLLVQLGGQLGVGLLEGLQQLEARLALVALLLLATLLLLLRLLAVLTTALALLLLVLVLVPVLVLVLVVLLFVALVFGLVIVQAQAAVALATRALAAALALLLVLIFVIFQLFILIVLVVQVTRAVQALFLVLRLLVLQGAEEAVEARPAGVTGAGNSQAKSDEDEYAHCR